VINIPGFGATTGSGSGDTSGPSSSTNNNFAAFNGTTGKLLKDSGYSYSTFALASHTHAASDLVSGTVATARLGSGTANNTTYLRGDQTWATVTASETVQPRIADGRLTLTTGTPVMTSAATAQTTLYYTPYIGNQIALYNGSAWVYVSFTEVSLSLSGHTANTNYDIWGYSNSGTLTLESTAWTNDTTRATALTTQNGVYVKSGATTRRYLGTIRITGSTGQCEYSFGGSANGGTEGKLYVWNAQNRVRVSALSQDSTSSWTYTTASWRSANNSTANRISFVQGLQLEYFTADNFSLANGSPASQFAAIGIGINSTSSPTGRRGYVSQGQATEGRAIVDSLGQLGFNYVQALEYAGGSTMTFYGSGAAAYIGNGIALSILM
jgi:hypothetical protein